MSLPRWLAELDADTPQGAAMRAAFAEYGPPITQETPMDSTPASSTTLPTCCYPRLEAETAEHLYCAYQRGGPPERAGLAWDGRPCPTWAELLAKQEAGDAGASGVVAKWRAVAELVRATS